MKEEIETDSLKSEPHNDDDGTVTPACAMKLRSSLRRFAHTERSTTSSAGKQKTVKLFRDRGGIFVKNPRYRDATLHANSSCQLVNPAGQSKRAYAPPEKYQHLKYLVDYLQPGLESKFHR